MSTDCNSCHDKENSHIIQTDLNGNWRFPHGKWREVWATRTPEKNLIRTLAWVPLDSNQMDNENLPSVMHKSVKAVSKIFHQFVHLQRKDDRVETEMKTDRCGKQHLIRP